MNQRKFWDITTKSNNLREEWICDRSVTDQQCLDALGELKGKTLDLGCGIGRLTKDYGIDISSKMLQLAKPGPEYKLCTGYSIPYPNKFFDTVFSTFVFQHINNNNKVLYIRESYRVLKDGGVFKLQFVNHGDRGPMSKPASNELMEDLFTRVGFEVTELKTEIYKEWTWLTAIKS